ncbi:proteinase-activated receptor 2 isoform X2 [Hippocampus comes]|uniref:Coagulation factor II (thrombin) receptor-like 1, tandem duplicate 2 n=1 Tax=Hippocampus comes TaxID=109280 RepID=A0A3Q2XWL3_HIPCM|nr:PREDICTED: proteinase-activated receptor 2 isoform X2 [Hippocampus comes]
MTARDGRLVLVVFLLRFLHTGSCDTEDLRGFTGTETTGGILLSLHAESVLSSGLTTIFLPIVYIVVFVVGLPANAMAVWVFLFRTKKKHPSSIYMANLALADLLFVIWVPLKIAYHFNLNNWAYGEGLCKVLVGFFYGNMYCSMAFIACISVQRYWAVVHPLAQRRRENTVAYVSSAAIWATVWLLTVPLYLYDQEVRVVNLNILTCHDVTRPSQKKMAAGYFLTMGSVGFVGPATVCAISNVLMLRALRSSMTVDATVSKKRRKAVVLIITVLLMFMVCFAPSNIMLLVHYVLLLNEVPNNLYGFYISTLCLASLNSCIDPFVYYYISDDFRQHVKNTFLCRSQRTVERMRVSFSALKFSKKSNTYMSDSSGNTGSSQC